MRGRPWRLWRSRLSTALLFALGVTVLLAGIAIRVSNLHLDTVLSNSMQPTFSAGDLVITQTIPVDTVRVGDVITFIQPGSSRPLIHRITSMENGVITTRGDTNPVDDPWRITLTSTTTDRLVAVVPYLGWLTQLQRPALLLAGVVLGLAIVLELGREVGKRLAKHRPYRLHP
jgi:signal peptidase